MAARARLTARRRPRRRAGLRARALPGRPERRAPARADLRVAASRALGLRALATREPLVAGGSRSGARVDPVLRRPPRARGGAVLRALRRLPEPRSAGARRRGARDAGRGREQPPGGALRRLGLDRLRRPVAAGGLALLGERARLRDAPPAPRARELRLPGLAHSAARPRGAGAASRRATLGAGARAAARRARADPARLRDEPAALLLPLAPLRSAPLPARAGAAAADRLSGPGGAGRLRRRPGGSGVPAASNSLLLGCGSGTGG